MRCPLDHELPEPILPAGYTLRLVEKKDVSSRAAAQYAALQSSTQWREYLQKYVHFMDSPGYPLCGDWVVLAPDGCVAAFCNVWYDAVSRTGQIEPVGTHPDFQRKGLGKAVMTAGMRFLQSKGMGATRICVIADNLPAIKLYESVGFRLVNKLLLHQKAIQN